MNFLLDNWMLLAMALASGLALLLPVLSKGSGVDPQAMVQLMNRDKAVVIDVCEPDEFARSHVIGAKNLPLGQLEDKLSQVVKNKSTHVIMVCQVGARSARAAATARKLGYENVQSLSGGLRAWTAASMPTEKS
ncbi:MAG: rhodanese-like domain-containing protein [Limnohabitans sp.]|nr:rhodanese-like domain-containing protein [Limnohabitans sp.]MDP4733886.1 rhodanese-like domain-containing protein [Limnohabitans sp.]MDP4771160.1 rhodanese-like domain-containing protein [Limnohabitans sp.]MDP4923500.1 rhodanese-like domain-containing protein [Limnohabitans sp.]